MSTAAKYEFTQEQNSQLRNLAGKMSFVGFFSAAFGVIALLTCLLTVAFIFQDRLPAGFRQKAGEYMQKAQASLPDDLKQQASQYSLDRIPTGHNFLSGVAIFTGVTGLIFLLQGIWNRSSAGTVIVSIMAWWMASPMAAFSDGDLPCLRETRTNGMAILSR